MHQASASGMQPLARLGGEKELNRIQLGFQTRIRKCNKFGYRGKTTSKTPPVICSCAINAKCPQVWDCFKRVKFRLLQNNALIVDATARKIETLPAPRPRLNCLPSRPLMWVQNTCRSFRISVPVYFASCFTYNICSDIRAFLHITSLLQVTSWTCSTNSKVLVTFAWHFFELPSAKGWAVAQKFILLQK